MSAATLKAYARMKADETISPSQSEGVQPDPELLQEPTKILERRTLRAKDSQTLSTALLNGGQRFQSNVILHL